MSQDEFRWALERVVSQTCANCEDSGYGLQRADEQTESGWVLMPCYGCGAGWRDGEGSIGIDAHDVSGNMFADDLAHRTPRAVKIALVLLGLEQVTEA